MITNRDKKVIEFLSNREVAATTEQLQRIFFPSKRVAHRRLKLLHEYKEIKRDRSNITMQYIYYQRKPKRLKHALLLAEFYASCIEKGIKIQIFESEFEVGNVRADALLGYRYLDKKYLAFVEIQRSTNKLDVDKYKKLYLTEQYKERLKIMPRIIAVTNQKIPSVKHLNITGVKLDMSNIKSIVLKPQGDR